MLSQKMIGQRIADARKKSNISQAQLAERLFISSQAVGKWERGESMPDITTFNRLAEILGVDLNYFSESVSSNTEKASTEALDEQSTEMSSGTQNLAAKAGKKLSWDMSHGNWGDADFSGLKNLHEKFSSSNMQRCQFVGSDMSELLLKSNHVVDCDFSNSDINNSHIRNSHLSNNIFKGCSLKETEFSRSHIEGCDFSGTNFTGAVFKTSTCLKNTMTNAVLNRTSFIASDIHEIVFEGILDDCYFENCSFKKTVFQNSTLINTFFKNTSLKRIQFINCKADKLTYAFLKNGKADLTGVSLITHNV